MPGISFIGDLTGDLSGDDSAILSASDSLVHDERYERQVLLKDNFRYLGYTAYREYPIESIDVGNGVIYLEGRLYGGDHAVNERKLNALADSVFNIGDRSEERIVEWLLNTDGDFVVILFHKKTGDVTIINDALGRLPLYCYRTNDKLILSRELRFVAKLMDRVRFDQMAIAQHLLIGYPLGKKTLLENVDRLAPATRIRVSIERAQIRVDNLHCFNFELKANDESSPEDTASELVALFSEACEARSVPGVQNVISLSGGFDSRSVAACFHKRRIPFRTATFLDHLGIFTSDARIAGQLANSFNVEWELFRLSAPNRHDVLKLLRMKNGLHPLEMAFILPYLERIRNGFGSKVLFITGDGGDKVLPDLQPPGRLAGLESLVDHLMFQNRKLPLDTVIALTGIPRADIIGELRHHVSAYPEETWGQKYVHFMITERAYKWLFEGEDRNRCYFWSTTPFYGIRFFKYAMRCPDERKSYYGLYREFLRALSPAAAAIEHAGMAAPIASDKFRLACKALALLGERPERRRRVERAVGSTDGYGSDSMIMHCIRQQMAGGHPIFEYLSARSLRTMVEQCASHTIEAIETLFTITSTIEDLTTGKSVLEQYG